MFKPNLDCAFSCMHILPALKGLVTDSLRAMHCFNLHYACRAPCSMNFQKFTVTDSLGR